MHDLYDRITEVINPDLHPMKWNLSVSLEPAYDTGEHQWWTLKINFEDWGPTKIGVKFWYQDDREVQEEYPVHYVDNEDVPEAVINRFIQYFENETL